MKKVLFLLVMTSALLSLFPFATDAQGLIPCGYDKNGDGRVDQSEQCRLCHVFVLLGNIINFFLYPNDLNNNFALVPIVATIFIVIGGVYLLLAAGNPTQLSKAKSILTAVVAGLIIIYAADLLLNTLFFAIDVNPSFELKSWTNTASWCRVK